MFESQPHLDIVIQDIQKNMPPFLRARDLVRAGLYKSSSDVCWAMKRGKAPPSIKLSSHKVIFPRASLCVWLKEKSQIIFTVQGGDLCNLK